MQGEKQKGRVVWGRGGVRTGLASLLPALEVGGGTTFSGLRHRFGTAHTPSNDATGRCFASEKGGTKDRMSLSTS